MNAKDQAEGGSGLQEAKDRVTLVVFTSSDGDFEVILLNFSYRIANLDLGSRYWQARISKCFRNCVVVPLIDVSSIRA